MTSLETESNAIIVTVTCGSCGTKLRASATSAGEMIKCTRCGAKLRVQLPSPEPVPSALQPPADEPPASQAHEPQDSVVRQAATSQAAGPQSAASQSARPQAPVPPSAAPEAPGPQAPAPEAVTQTSARQDLLPQAPAAPAAPAAQATLSPTSVPPADAPPASALHIPTPVDRTGGKPRVVIFPSSEPQPPSTGTPQNPASSLSETDLLLSGAGEMPAWTDPSDTSSTPSASPASSAPPPAFPTSATPARPATHTRPATPAMPATPARPARTEEAKPTVAAHPVPQRTFTDSVIADELMPEAAAPRAMASEAAASRTAASSAAASRAAVMAAISGAAVPDAALCEPALPPASSCTENEAEPGARPRYRREGSTPVLPEPIPAMAVLPPQRTAPYLPAATLPASARRGRRGTSEEPAETRGGELPVAESVDSAGASWSRALVLAAAVVVIGAFAWLLADRIGGVRQWWIVKFACVAWLIGMATATAMISSGRSGAVAKMGSILGAALAIVLGKALILCLPQVPAELMQFDDLRTWARTFANLAFIPVDPLFFAMAVTGSTVRFMLSKRDE